jgi:hypothetical protein
MDRDVLALKGMVQRLQRELDKSQRETEKLRLQAIATRARLEVVERKLPATPSPPESRVP